MSTALAIKYQLRNETFPYPAQPPSAASYTLNAPNVYDGSVGDTSTGYTVPAATGSPAPISHLYVLIDLGPSPPSVSAWEYEPGANVFLSSSSDGSTWTIRDSSPGAGSPASLGGALTFRYWVVDYQNILTSTSYLASDARLYDGASALINGPAIAGGPLRPLISRPPDERPRVGFAQIIGPPPMLAVPPGATPQYLTTAYPGTLTTVNPAPDETKFLPGPLLVDGFYRLGGGGSDSTTGYTSAITGPGQTAVVYGLYDLKRPVNLSGFSLNWLFRPGQYLGIWYANHYSDLATVTPFYLGSADGFHEGNGFAQFYEILDFNGVGKPVGAIIVALFGQNPVTLTDFRLFAADGSLYPIFAPASDAATGHDVASGTLLVPINDGDTATGTDALAKTVGRPTVIFGSTRVFPSLGAWSTISTDYNLPTTVTWEIFYMLGGTSPVFVGDNTTRFGLDRTWLVSWDGANFTVGAPSTGDPTIGSASWYLLIYQTAPGTYIYAYFDTEALPVVIKALSDSATGTEDLSLTGALAMLSDGATGTDTSTVIATAAMVDSAIGLEGAIGPSQGILATDSASGADTASVTCFQTMFETGTAIDIMSKDDGVGGVTFGVPLNDGATGTDAATVTATAAMTDGATGLDVISLVPPTIGLSDTASGIDTSSVPGASTGRLQVFFD